jgi:hypothetical protein
MQQQDLIIRQLAQKVTDFIEPVIPYLVIGSGKAAIEAGKKVGPEIWEIKKKLWKKLCSRDRPELKGAAGDLVVAPCDSEVKQVFVQGIVKLLEQDPDLAIEISRFMEDEIVQKIMARENSDRLVKQNSIDKTKILEEFNKLIEEFLAKSTAQDLEQFKLEHFELPDTKKNFPDLKVAAGNEAVIKNPRPRYTHIQLTQGIATEDSSPIAIRMAKIAGMDFKGQSEAQKYQTLLSLVSQFEGPIKEEFMERALVFASGIPYGDVRSKILSLLVPYLDGPGRTELIEKALYSASSIDDEDERAAVLSSLLPYLRGPGKERFIENIFAFAVHIRYGDTKFQILSSLIPHLYGSRNEMIMEKALELASGIQSEYRRVESFSMLTPYLKGQRKDGVIEETLQLASNLKDKDMRPEALSFIIQYLDGARQKDILQKALEMASEIKSESRRVQALSSLVPYLDESAKEEIMEKILKTGTVTK